jgi:hypothetical protein
MSCSTVPTTAAKSTGRVLATSYTAVLLLEMKVKVLHRQLINQQINPPKKISLVQFNMTAVCGIQLLPIKMKKCAPMVMTFPKLGMISRCLREAVYSFPVPLIVV